MSSMILPPRPSIPARRSTAWWWVAGSRARRRPFLPSPSRSRPQVSGAREPSCLRRRGQAQRVHGGWASPVRAAGLDTLSDSLPAQLSGAFLRVDRHGLPAVQVSVLGRFGARDSAQPQSLPDALHRARDLRLLLWGEVPSTARPVARRSVGP